jgi:hypothetical protein
MADYIKDFGDYSVKNVKNFMGREGYGFNCTLYRNGKKVGTCIDDASGGGMYPVDWDRKVDRKEEQRLLNEHIKSLPKIQYSSERELTVDERHCSVLKIKGKDNITLSTSHSIRESKIISSRTMVQT